MSAALTLPAPIPPPGPDRVRLAVAGALSLARFLRQVIDCGKQLLVAVRERAHTPDFPRFTQPFGTTYLPHILRRIATAIRCAVLLEQRALQDVGAMPPTRFRERSPSSGRTHATPDDAPPGANQAAGSQRAAPPGRPSGDPRYADWPSTAQLTEEMRRRSIGAVLTDICRGLGITPEHPLWPQMRLVIAAYGGDHQALEADAGERWCSTRWLRIPFTPPPVHTLTLWPEPWSHPVTAAAAAATATGPP
jgi:hypothetical protein